MKINHNISALNAYRNLSINTENTSKSLEKLSSGLRINRASDDAAGLAISEKMRSQIRGLDMAERNSLDGISLIQTAEGGLSSTHEILQRMRELAVQASNGTITDADRDEVQKEITQLTSEINRIGTDTEFNTAKLLDGSRTGEDGAIHFQTGANAGQSVILEINDMSADKLGVSSEIPGKQTVELKDKTKLSVWYTETNEVTNGDGAKQYSVDVSTVEKASSAITLFEDAIQRVSSERSRLGAVQNRLEYTIDNLSVMSENLTSAESRIRDLDMALEMTNFTKNNILNQAAQSMLAQANQMPQGVLQLLK
ncbi:flagellin [Peribacillus sp. FSL H8-0477]|uniref:flagellin N-terminal helical domain-containing protein n=1 Tax=Peribacillus sp. FSL H8-0477 TaxID=2921388 RepID=UPI0030F85A2F